MNRNLRALVEWSQGNSRLLSEGGQSFFTIGRGSDAKAAFANARARAAANMDGDEEEGYSGTIYEKRSFVLIPLPKGADAREYAGELIKKEDKRIDDKWGPAGAIDIGNGGFLFFGWASS